MTAAGPATVLMWMCSKPGPANARPGGISNAMLSHARALIAVGVPVEVWGGSAAIAEAARGIGATAVAHPALRNGVAPLFSPAAWRAAAQLRRRRVSAVIHHSARSWFAALLFFPSAMQAQVLHRHGVGAYRWLRNWIALSRRFAEEMRAAHPWRRVAYAPNGLRIDVVVPDAPPPGREAADGPLRVVALGRTGFFKGTFHSKGFDLLVEAAARLKDEGVAVEVEIGGDPDPNLEALAAELGVADRVRLAGWVADVPAFMRRGDVFCLPSRIEPFGLVVLEAMSQARPVVASATHGPLDLVEEGRTGLLFPVDDAAGLAAALRRIAETPDRGRAMGLAAHAKLLREFSPEAVGRGLLAALHALGMRDAATQRAAQAPALHQDQPN